MRILLILLAMVLAVITGHFTFDTLLAGTVICFLFELTILPRRVGKLESSITQASIQAGKPAGI